MIFLFLILYFFIFYLTVQINILLLSVSGLFTNDDVSLKNVGRAGLYMWRVEMWFILERYSIWMGVFAHLTLFINILSCVNITKIEYILLCACSLFEELWLAFTFSTCTSILDSGVVFVVNSYWRVSFTGLWRLSCTFLCC